jgi:uncharacterized protein (TIGR02996 family)
MDDLALTQAWDAALASTDPTPWRVLADLLQEAGDPRGELLRLQLDAETGGVKGLAKGRLGRLLDEAGAALRQLGMSSFVMNRGVVRHCTVAVVKAKAPKDWWWAGVERCTFQVPEGGPFDRRAWLTTPLAGPRMKRVEQLYAVEREGLALLAGGIARPRLPGGSP